MSDPATALSGASSQGYVAIREDDPRAMVQLKGDLSDTALASAIRDATDADMPGPLKIATGERGAALWMAPDELLLLLPAGTGPEAVARLTGALAGIRHLALDVSDMRASLRLEGAAIREVLAKLTPADMAPGRFEPGQVRRTRLAQVPAALWLSDGETGHVLCFRSVARYVFDILEMSARDGGEVGVF